MTGRTPSARTLRRRPRPEVAATALLAVLLLPPATAQEAGRRADDVDGTWRRATPEEVGLDPGRLDAGLAAAAELAGIRTLLVVRRGALVAQRSFGGGAPDEPLNIKSASKSILSALVGIALERGWIGSLDATLGQLLPETTAALPEAKRAITLGDLLTMRSGLASTSGEHYGAWVATDDWTAAALARPLVDEPGTRFRYSTGDTHLVSAVLTVATGRSTLELARELLAEPLGITIHSWQRAPEGVHFGGNNLELTPLDLARFGQLYLQGGRWGDRQIVPAEWVAQSTSRHAEGWPERYGAYGYLWWRPPDDPRNAFAAVGYGSQVLYVVPELDMLVVVTATLEGKGADWDRRLYRILRDEIFGAAS